MSTNRVPGTGYLKNKLGINRVRAINEEEFKAYIKTEEKLINLFTAEHSFTADDLKVIHKEFLGSIYEWAGETRSVDISKGGFPFASAKYLSKTLDFFEKNILKKCTPCNSENTNKVVYKIAKVHAELLIIHPFREGNGRVARLLASIIAFQAGLPRIDFSFIGKRGKNFEKYITAIQNGDNNDYKEIQEIILKALNLAIAKQPY